MRREDGESPSAHGEPILVGKNGPFCIYNVHHEVALGAGKGRSSWARVVKVRKSERGEGVWNMGKSKPLATTVSMAMGVRLLPLYGSTARNGPICSLLEIPVSGSWSYWCDEPAKKGLEAKVSDNGSARAVRTTDDGATGAESGLVRHYRPLRILLDCGIGEAFDTSVLEPLFSNLRAFHGRFPAHCPLDAIVLSHPDLDHAGGVPVLFHWLTKPRGHGGHVGLGSDGVDLPTVIATRETKKLAGMLLTDTLESLRLMVVGAAPRTLHGVHNDASDSLFNRLRQGAPHGRRVDDSLVMLSAWQKERLVSYGHPLADEASLMRVLPFQERDVCLAFGNITQVVGSRFDVLKLLALEDARDASVVPCLELGAATTGSATRAERWGAARQGKEGGADATGAGVGVGGGSTRGAAADGSGSGPSLRDEDEDDDEEDDDDDDDEDSDDDGDDDATKGDGQQPGDGNESHRDDFDESVRAYGDINSTDDGCDESRARLRFFEGRRISIRLRKRNRDGTLLDSGSKAETVEGGGGSVSDAREHMDRCGGLVATPYPCTSTPGSACWLIEWTDGAIFYAMGLSVNPASMYDEETGYVAVTLWTLVVPCVWMRRGAVLLF